MMRSKWRDERTEAGLRKNSAAKGEPDPVVVRPYESRESKGRSRGFGRDRIRAHGTRPPKVSETRQAREAKS